MYFHIPPSSKESLALYLTYTLRQFGLSFVTLYLPIFFFSLGDSIHIHPNKIVNSIIFTFLIFAIDHFLTGSATILFEKIIFKINFRRSILLSSFFLVAKLLFYSQAGQNILFLIPATAFSAVATVFFWVPYQILFIRKFAKRGLAKATGRRSSLLHLLYVVGPLVSGILIAKTGYTTIFILSAVIIVTSTLPIFFYVSENQHRTHTLKSVMGYLKYKKIVLSLSAANVEASLYDYLWPIFLFISLASVVKVGLLVTASILIAAGMDLYIGNKIAKGRRKKIHATGIGINSFLHILRLFAVKPMSIYFVDIIDKINTPVYSVPYLTQFYEKAKRIGDSDIIILREIVIHMSTSLALFTSVVLLFFLPNWTFLFLLAAVASLLTYSISSDKN